MIPLCGVVKRLEAFNFFKECIETHICWSLYIYLAGQVTVVCYCALGYRSCLYANAMLGAVKQTEGACYSFIRYKFNGS